MKNELLIASTMFTKHGAVTEALIQKVTDKRVQLALQSCHEIIEVARYYVDRVIPTNESLSNVERRQDFRTWLSGVGSVLEFCKEEFSYTSDEVKRVVTQHLDNSKKVANTSLAIISTIDEQMQLFPGQQATNWPPSWLSNEDKTLLDDTQNVVPNLIVAKDGSGNYKTISDALKVVHSNSNKRFTIYVKRGVYVENPQVPIDKQNVFMFGDGPHMTIISSNQSNRTGFPTMQSATFGNFSFLYNMFFEKNYDTFND